MQTLAAAALVILLAVAAVILPSRDGADHQAVLLIFDSAVAEERTGRVFKPLRHYLSEAIDGSLSLVVVATVKDFQEELEQGPDFVLCPDGLGLGLGSQGLAPLAVGRRPAPRNLRPRGILVYRKSAGLVAEPWLDRSSATVVGDSLSLAATGIWRRPGGELRSELGGLAFGPDPYDHSAVLNAARLGCYDYALVRQWDADRFFKSGLLSPLEWGMEVLTPPVPDITLFVARDLSAGVRLAVGEKLTALGRAPQEIGQQSLELELALRHLWLVGFNLLVEPDLDLVRRNFPLDWPPASE